MKHNFDIEMIDMIEVVEVGMKLPTDEVCIGAVCAMEDGTYLAIISYKDIVNSCLHIKTSKVYSDLVNEFTVTNMLNALNESVFEKNDNLRLIDKVVIINKVKSGF